MSDFSNEIQSANEAVQSAKDKINELKETKDSIGEALGSISALQLGVVQPFLKYSGVLGKAEDTVNIIKNRLSSGINSLVEQDSTGTINSIRQTIQNARQAVSDAQNAVSDGVQNARNAVSDGVQNAVSDARNAVSNVSDADVALSPSSQALGSTTNSLADIGTDTEGLIANALRTNDLSLLVGRNDIPDFAFNAIAKRIQRQASQATQDGLDQLAPMRNHLMNNRPTADDEDFNAGEPDDLGGDLMEASDRTLSSGFVRTATSDASDTAGDTAGDTASNVAGDTAGDVAGDVAGDSAVAGLETAGSALDASGIGAVLGVGLNVVGGLVELGTSLGELFDKPHLNTGNLPFADYQLGVNAD